ncbi:gamma-glutamyltransferase [Lutibaculum baratangense]|uniref:Glutathione hydrolase proenzyme n=1 Tax=Lutibaculum baratangense AMV1 TaxID=631454 RepID=V4RCU5_9HYPH|nr:gamma-glutamyltransferase [Lutibaculum baratangense]ESR23219.1 Gamma-glutamyltranspeptidase [Lutibaculum baratangense AMV1]
MSARDWRRLSPVDLACEKRPASGAGGMVVTNHPLGTAAGAEILSAGGNAVDAAVASLLALTVVEPMMVGIAGGGLSHLRLADGRHLVFDAMSTAPGAAHATCFEPVSDEPPNHMETVGRRSAVGPTAVAVPGNLLGWWTMQQRFGRLPFADVVDPAIRLAARGFAITHYLAGAIGESREDLARDPVISSILLPGGEPPKPGERLAQPGYAESLRLIAREGAAALHGGELGRALVARIRAGTEDDGWLSEEDLESYRVMEREPVVGTYRGHEIVGPPPPASSGVHVTQMLNIVEGFDVRAMGFGTPDTLHLMAEAIRIAFADRVKTSGDPDFVDVPVERLTSKAYAEECRRQIDFGSAGPAPTATAPYESRDTTHVTVADREGNVVTATHTINGIFGARFMVPEAGFIPNNYMSNFDPHPGRALSVAPGKRVPTSMAPMMVLKDGRPLYALGLPGGLRIFPSAFQAIVNLVDHRMGLQEAVEAPRLWTQGQEVEIEKAYAEAGAEEALAASGHEVKVVPHIGGGMNAIAFEQDGTMTGAACWRADGTVMALGGGLARPGVRFWPDRVPPSGGEAEDAEPRRPAG